MDKIKPNLWFDDQAQDAADFYCEVFDDAEVGEITRYGETGQDVTQKEPGSVMTVSWRIGDTTFVGINGGPQFKFDEAISFEITCEDQDEVDYYWEKLTADGGSEGQCGWCKDKFGVSWQVVPKGFAELMSEGDSEKIERAMAAMFKMQKLDIAELRRAAEGTPAA